KRMIPQLVAWTTKPGQDYADLEELYTESLAQWNLYMGHVATVIAGVNVDLKTADQSGAVYRIVPKVKQEAALAFLNDNVIVTPEWLQPSDIVSRVGPAGLSARQSAILTSLMSVARLGRLTELERFDAANAYPVEEHLADLKNDVWGDAGGAAPAANAPDANRRELQRTYLQRLGVIISPPPPPAAPAGAGA